MAMLIESFAPCSFTIISTSRRGGMGKSPLEKPVKETKNPPDCPHFASRSLVETCRLGPINTTFARRSNDAVS